MPVNTTREIAADAIRERLVDATLEVVLSRGYADVTISELAAAAGVSRSTYLRYVGSKPEAVGAALFASGDEVTAALRERPADEPTWTALRRAFDAFVRHRAGRSKRSLDVAKMIWTEPALGGELWMHLRAWRADLAAVLRERDPQLSPMRAVALAGAAIECLDCAVVEWVETVDAAALTDLLDEAFAAVGAAAP
jgi:AcrR family transcriptional regulator